MTALRENEIRAVLDCFAGGWLTLGPRTQKLEEALAGRLGVEHAAAVSSGTAALHLAFLALRTGPGDEVVVPAAGGEDAAAAVRRTGAVVVTAAVDAGDPVLTRDDAEAALTPATKAVVVVHPHGFPAPAAAGLRALCDERGIALVEDATRALGADGIGRAGHLTCLSFARDRQLPVGEAGMVAGTDAELVGRARLLRSHAMTASTWDRHRGHSYSYDIVDVGFNYRIDEPRSALALALLERLDELVAARRDAARALHAELAAAGRGPLWGPDRIAAAAPLALPLADGSAAPVKL
jgi:dTDP-4-amino-4,6-dideoxygalactose transaminase